MPDEYSLIHLPADALPEVTDLHGDLRLLAELVGVPLALKVGQVVNGTPLRIYGVPRWLRRYRDEAMRREYDAGGITIVDLARKYGIGERQAYNILGTAVPDDRQLNLWK